MSKIDKEPLWIFLSATAFLVTLGSILFFLISWLIIATANWKMIIAIIFLVVVGLIILFTLYVFVSSGVDVIKEIILEF